MEKRQGEYKIGGKAMPMRDGPPPFAVADLGQAHKIEEMIAAHERIDDAERDDDQQKPVKEIMRRLG